MARNDAMGGIGVASSTIPSAAVINPALISMHEKNHNDIYVTFPSAGFQLTDKHKVIRRVDDMVNEVKYYENYFHGLSLDELIQHYDMFCKIAGYEADRLNELRNKEINAKGGVAFAVAIPNDLLSIAIITKAYTTAHLRTNIVQQDIDYLQAINNGTIIPIPGDQHQLHSSASGLIAFVTDYGVAFAKEYSIGKHAFSLSLTPKLQQYRLFNYTDTLYRYNKKRINNSSYRKIKSSFNTDIGLAMDINSHWRFGVTGQNLLAKNIETKMVGNYSDVYQIRPLVTAGVAWNNGRFTTSIDSDLTQTKQFRSQANSQYIGLGMEYRAFSWLQLRAGYRTDIKSHDVSTFSTGFGLLPFNNAVHFDLAGTVGSDNTWGAMVQINYSF